ncbi:MULTISPECIES: DUF2247 family protein [unclassified Actinopolyspora]|uniref:DUF2247 family protein n=1 Tax=unclassified Actinopolyspora TaxID=2639451 RepID=UPI0013F68AC9|nr:MULTISPECIES: DUF2247 family protein [unclassified Actinopolyspora]NHD18469.1 DUF2247 family protein [Actinopolyspora sp. BKK2]NHE77572.1 DUF2247 family protein [Actinopolyspora sp. BKK1]
MKEFQVLRSLGVASWPVLRYGLEENWVSFEDVSNYAADVLAEEREDADDRAVRLAVYDFEGKEEALDLCGQLGKLNNEDADPEKILKTWILVRLTVIEKNWEDSEEKIDKIGEAYASLEYPEEMRFCSRYDEFDYSTGKTPPVHEECPLDEARRLINELSEELSVRRDC